MSADNHSNIFNFHYTYLVTLVPVCKDDLVLLPKRLAESLGSISRLVATQRVTSAVQFVDPLTAQTADVTEEKVRYEAACRYCIVAFSGIYRLYLIRVLMVSGGGDGGGGDCSH